MNILTMIFLTELTPATPSNLDAFFILITEFGSEAFFIIVIPPIYWCINKKFGYRLLILTTIAAYISTVLKNLVGMERPPKHLMKAPAGPYAFPSGHAHGATTFWGYIIVATRQKFFLILGTFIIILVAYSRVYLRVHYPGDVIGGIALGIGTVAIFLYFDPKVTRIVKNLEFQQKLIIGMLIPLLLLIPGTLFYDYDSRGVKLSGAMMGMILGYLLENEFIKFSVAVPGRVKIMRIIIGLAISYTAYFIIGKMVPPSIITSFSVAWLGGFTVTAIAPWLFTHLEKTKDN